MGVDLNIITRAEAARIAGTSTSNIQRLESLGDFPRRVQRGEPGKPACYERTQVMHWIRTRRRSSDPQLAPNHLRRLFHNQRDANLHLHQQVEALNQQRDNLHLQHTQLQDLHAQLQADFDNLQVLHDETQALLTQAQQAQHKLQRLRKRDAEHAKERTDLLKLEIEQLRQGLAQQAAQLQQASLNAEQSDKLHQALKDRLENVRTLHSKARKQRDEARKQRDKARKQRDDAKDEFKDELNAAHDQICALESSLGDAKDALNAAEVENLRLQQSHLASHALPTPAPQRPPVGRGQRAANATRQRHLELEQTIQQQRAELEQLRALLDQRHTERSAPSRGLAWANDILRTSRKALIQLHTDTFGYPPRRDIGIKSLRHKLLNHHGWRHFKGTLVPIDP